MRSEKRKGGGGGATSSGANTASVPQLWYFCKGGQLFPQIIRIGMVLDLHVLRNLHLSFTDMSYILRSLGSISVQ